MTINNYIAIYGHIMSLLTMFIRFFVISKTVDLVYIALHDVCENDNYFSKIFKELDIYENFDTDDSEILQEIILLKGNIN